MISNVTSRAKIGNYKIPTVISKKYTNKKKSQKECRVFFFPSSFQSRATVHFYTRERTNTIDILKQKQIKVLLLKFLEITEKEYDHKLLTEKAILKYLYYI